MCNFYNDVQKLTKHVINLDIPTIVLIFDVLLQNDITDNQL